MNTIPGTYQRRLLVALRRHKDGVKQRAVLFQCTCTSSAARLAVLLPRVPRPSWDARPRQRRALTAGSRSRSVG
jgi:hypothetical protein